MIIFKNIKIRNFKSFSSKEVTVPLNKHASVLIIGDNKDIGQQGTSKNGVGKCHSKGTPIMMYDRSIKMVEDVVVGDKVMGDDGSPRTVMNTTSGQEDMFLVRQKLGMDYVVNKSHILSLRVGTTRPKYGHVKGEIINIPIETYLSYPESVKKGVCGYIADLTEYGEDAEDCIHPWLLGLWLADGHSASSRFTINSLDHDTIRNIEYEGEKHGYLITYPPYSNKQDKNYTTLSVTDGFVSFLRDNDIFGSGMKRVPEKYLSASYNTRLEVLAGFLDGDGYTESGRHFFEMTLKNTQLVDDIVFLARSLGFRTTVKDKFCKCQDFDGTIYKRIHITGELEKIPNRLIRKKKHPKSASSKPRNFGSTGISVEPVGFGDYYGFEVDGNHLYCLGDMTVVHNSAALEAVCYALYGKPISKQKTDELINIINGKNMVVELDLEINGKQAKITRGRKPNVLEFSLDGKNLTRDSMKNTDQEIVDALGMDYDVFLSIVFLSPFKESFMSLSSAEQRNFIETILSLDTLGRRAESVKAIKKNLVTDIKLATKDRDNALALKDQAEKHIDSIRKRSEQFESKREEKIAELKDLLAEFHEIDFDKAYELAKEIKGLRALREQLVPTIPDYSDLTVQYRTKCNELDHHAKTEQRIDAWYAERDEKVKNLREKIDSLPSAKEINDRETIDNQVMQMNQDILQINDGIRKMNTELENVGKKQDKLEAEFEDLDAGTCPYCKQRHTDEDRIEYITQEFAELEDQRHKLTTTIKERGEEAKDVEKRLEGIRKQRPDISNTITTHEVERLTDELEGTLNMVCPYEDQLEEDVDWLRAEVEGLSDRINKATEERVRIETEIGDIDSEIDSKNTALLKIIDVVDPSEIKVLMNEGAKLEDDIKAAQDEENPFESQLADMTVPDDHEYYEKLIQDLTDKERHAGYLVKLLTDPKSFIRKNIVDQFLPFLNKKIVEYTDYLGLPHVSEVNNDMTVDIEYLGKTVGYYSLSRGERLRLDVATSMAFREMLKLLGLSTNLLMIDEIFDSAIDSYGSKQMFDFIGDFADNILLISHRDEFEDMVEAKIKVIKTGGFSDLVIEE